MEGHFLVCENAEEEFDISFQVNSTMDSVIPKDQQELYVKAESACNIIKALENTDKQTKKKYFDKLLSLFSGWTCGKSGTNRNSRICINEVER